MNGVIDLAARYFLLDQDSSLPRMPCFGRAHELGLAPHQRLEHGARLVDAQADADRHHQRQARSAAHWNAAARPGSRMSAISRCEAR